MINASARRYRIWICKPTESIETGLEVTEYCSSEGYFSVTDSPISEDGLLRTTGELVLTPPEGDPTFDTWENESRWAIGNRVIVQVADQSGTLRTHPRSGLYVLSDPKPPFPGKPEIRLELGDRVTLLSYRQPHSDQSAIEFGVDKSRTEIIRALLHQAELMLSGQIPGLLNYPIPKNENGFVQQAGRVAIAGASGLWQDNEGNIRAKRINLKPSKRLFKHTVGADDAGEYEPIQGSERPCSLMKVTGSGYELTPVFQGDRTVTQLYAPASSVDGGTNNNSVQVGSQTRSTHWVGNQFIQRTEEIKARGLLIPDDVYKAIDPNANPGSPFRQINALIDEEIQQYEGGEQGRLTSKTQKKYAPFGQIFADLYKRNPALGSIGLLSQITQSEEVVTTHGYRSQSGQDTQGQTREIITSTYRPAGAIAGAASDWDKPGAGALASLLTLAERRTERWTKQGGGWKYTLSVEQAGQVRSGTIQAFLALQIVEGESVTSRSGNTQPPAAERRQPLFERQETIYKGQAKFKSQAGDSFTLREHTIAVDYLTSKTEADRLANIFGTIRHGRHRGFRLVSALRDELFDWEPLCRVDLEWNGYIYQGLSDLVNWTLAGNEAIVTIECLRIGRYAIDRHAADPYPHAASAPLDPEPPPTELDPEAANNQPIAPLIQQVRDFAFETVNDFEWQLYPFALGVELPAQTYELETVSEITLARIFALSTVNEVGMAIAPIVNVNTINEISFSLIQPIDPTLTLISQWHLDDTSWIDSVGGHDLTDVYGGMELVPGFLGNAARSDVSYLSSDAPALATGNVHWRITCYIKPIDFSSDVHYLTRQDNVNYFEWSLEVGVSEGGIAFLVSTSSGSVVVNSTNTMTLNEWNKIECEVNPTTRVMSIAVNDITTNRSLASYEVPIVLNNADTRIASYCSAAIDEVEFFKEL